MATPDIKDDIYQRRTEPRPNLPRHWTHNVSIARDDVPVAQDSKPLVSVYIKKTSSRRYVAAVKYEGEWLYSEDYKSATAEQERAALNLLESKLTVLSATIPRWNVILVDETCNSKPKQVSLEDLPAVDRVTKAPVTDSAGYVTPLTDKGAWVEGYEAAVLAATGFESRMLRNLCGDPGKNFRQAVTTLMRSTGLVSPWGTSDEDVPWHIVARVYDPTSFPARPGEGERRVLKDLNGLERRVATGELVDRSRRRSAA
jgi:hypothetical protein